jgi:hypothetical protein
MAFGLKEPKVIGIDRPEIGPGHIVGGIVILIGVI